ncbi:bacteriohemerythrin [Pararhodospirillum photometricum]|nr:bacteriohemerythrin [Pararhodospirillum photometricum]
MTFNPTTGPETFLLSSDKPVRRRIALVLRTGLTGLTFLTLVATGGALAAFWGLTRDLTPIVTEALPALASANEMMRLVKTIDADARRLPNLEGDFAIETVRGQIETLTVALRATLDTLGEPRLPSPERVALEGIITQMEGTLHRLTALILERSQADAKLARRTQALVELRAQISAAAQGKGDGSAAQQAWTLMEASGLMLAALSSPDPRQIVDLSRAYGRQMDALAALTDAPLGHDEELLRDRTLGRLDALSDVFGLRLERQRLDVRIQGALRRLVVMDRLVQAVDEIAQALTRSSLDRATVLEQRLARLTQVMVWISVLALLSAAALLFFVNRRVVARMVSLQRGMHSHVVGDPLPLSTKGDDEVAAMAASFLHFVREVRAREARLEAQRQDLDQTMNELSDAYGVISSSIQYASSIQRAILPDETTLHRCFPEVFVIWEPRDVVAGDIYWCRPWGDGVLLLLGDCTGHGVPGAFMTLIANGAFHGAILEAPPGDPAALLARMHQLIQGVLIRDRAAAEGAPRLSAVDDGMEAGACFLNPDAGVMIFAGARFSLFVQDGETVEEIAGNRHGLGYRKVPHDATFTNVRLPISTSAWYILSTDGLIDQVGGERRRAFGKRRLREVLAGLDSLPPEARKAVILEALRAHQGDEMRRDDVSLIGFKGYGEALVADESWALTLDDALLTGVREIDEDHLKLFELVNRVGVVLARNDTERLARLISDLASYTHWHFRHEERLMQVHDYPGSAQHKREHDLLIQQTTALQARLASGDEHATDGLMDFLADWLRLHIQVMDKALGEYLLAFEAEKNDPAPSARETGRTGETQ